MEIFHPQANSKALTAAGRLKPRSVSVKTLSAILQVEQDPVKRELVQLVRVWLGAKAVAKRGGFVAVGEFKTQGYYCERMMWKGGVCSRCLWLDSFLLYFQRLGGSGKWYIGVELTTHWLLTFAQDIRVWRVWRSLHRLAHSSTVASHAFFYTVGFTHFLHEWTHDFRAVSQATAVYSPLQDFQRRKMRFSDPPRNGAPHNPRRRRAACLALKRRLCC